MWGKIKTNGDDWMYPKPLMDLRFCFVSFSLSDLFYIVFLPDYIWLSVLQLLLWPRYYLLFYHYLLWIELMLSWRNIWFNYSDGVSVCKCDFLVVLIGFKTWVSCYLFEVQRCLFAYPKKRVKTKFYEDSCENSIQFHFVIYCCSDNISILLLQWLEHSLHGFWQYAPFCWCW